MFLKACTDSKYLSSILFSKRFIEVCTFIIPAILILSVAITLFKIVLNPNSENIKKNLNIVYSKIIAAVIIFFIPTLVNVFMSTAGLPGVTTTTCWKNANTATIEKYKNAEKQREDAEEEKLKVEKEKADQERKVTEATREAARAKNEKDNEEAKKKALEAAEEASWNGTGKASATAAELIAFALSKKGMEEDPNEVTHEYGTIDGSYKYHWCAAFVWYATNAVGVYPTKVTLKSASPPAYVNYFKEKNQYQMPAAHGGNYVPKMGDFIFFNWRSDISFADHIGFVKTVSGEKVYTVEGNCSDTVCENSFDLNDSRIIGYGVWE